MRRDLEFCVYVHTCLALGDSYGKRYVGQTSQKPESRWGKGKKYSHCLYFDNAIRKYGWDSFSHEVVAYGLTHDEANELERKLISEYKSDNPKYGFNLTSGGYSLIGSENVNSKPVVLFDGKTGKRIADFECLSDAASYIGRPMKSLSACVTGNMRTCRGYICKYAEDVKNIDVLPKSERFGYRSHPEKQRPVDQFDCDGYFVRSYESIEEAAKELGLSTDVVGNAARGVSKSGGGFQWRYSSDRIKNLPKLKSSAETRWEQNTYHNKMIDQIDPMTGDVVKTFKSTRDAERQTGIRRSTIFMVLKKKPGKYTAGGYKWRYHDE